MNAKAFVKTGITYLMAAAFGIGIVIFPLLLPQAGENRRRPIWYARGQVQTIGQALLIYCDDNDGSFPAASHWNQAAESYRAHLTPHEEGGGPTGFAMMRKLEGTDPLKLSNPEKQALVFETTDSKRNAAYNFVNVKWRQERETVVAFADGSVKSFKEYDPGVPAAGTGLAP